jgi:DNA-binding SARP family transcriptional activator
MKVGENIYISRINETAKIYNFFKANNANAALEFVAEKTNVDVTDFLAESLEGEAAERAKLLSTISEKTDIINFLKDQRGLLAEADRSIEEIKAADALIEGEIERFENEVKELQSEL